MNQGSRIHNFVKNVLYAFAAQGISLILSFLLSLIVPKVLGVEEFGYWQLFLFYGSYSGCFFFGTLEGIYLRYGGIEYKDLDKNIIGSQLKAMMLVQFLIAALICFFTISFESSEKRQFVICATFLYVLLCNFNAFFSYIFQAANLTKRYSISVIISKVSMIIFIIVALLIGVNRFEPIVILNLLSVFVSCIYCIFIGQSIVFSKLCALKELLIEIGSNIKVGINLLVSNLATMLVVGSARFIVDRLWGISAFGKFSFALSLTSFFLLFIGQVSMVLFPTLRQSTDNQIKEFYNVSRKALGILLSSVFLFYLPIKYILSIWLPQYQESLAYLALFLPICTFDGKMQMLCSTYFKVLRKEKLLLYINLFTLALSLIFSILGAYVFNDIYVVIILLVVSIAVRSIISEIYLARLMKSNVAKDLIAESILCIVFVFCSCHLSIALSFFIYLLVYIIYLYLSRHRIKLVRSRLKLLLKK